MKFLMDTALFVWSINGELEKISREARTIIANTGNDIYLSSASMWEMAIKYSLGKLSLKMPLERLIDEHAAKMKLLPLAITHDHSLQVAKLPFHHKDPFDRLLIAQARIEDLPILTPDEHFRKYPVEVIW